MSTKVNESMLDLFNLEVDSQTTSSIEVLSAFDDIDDIDDMDIALETLMRAAHSIKGAASLVNVKLAIKLAHTMEDCFVSAQEDKIEYMPSSIDVFIQSINFLIKISKFNAGQHENPTQEILDELESLIHQLEDVLKNKNAENPEGDNKSESESEVKNEHGASADDELITGEIFSVPDNIDSTMLGLFKTELENNIDVISNGLLAIEDDPQDAQYLEQLMRASHSIKGAARLLGIESVVKLAHAMEDCFVAAQSGKVIINEDQTDVFLQCTDILKSISALSDTEHSEWTKENSQSIHKKIKQLNDIECGKFSGASNSPQEADGLVIDSNEIAISCDVFSVPADIDPTMLDLFKTELENNIDVISNGLLAIEDDPQDEKYLEQLMRASHSIKGAARLLEIESVVKLAHAMEDCFVAAQSGKVVINEDHTDVFLQCTDILKAISALADNQHSEWTKENSSAIHQQINQLNKIESGKFNKPKNEQAKEAAPTRKPAAVKKETKPESQVVSGGASSDAVVRVSAKRINNLMGLAGELSVTSNWVRSFSDSMLSMKKKHNELIDTIDRLRIVLEEKNLTDLENDLLSNIQFKVSSYRENLTTQIIDLDDFDRRSSNLTGRINHEIISSRMRPFKDSTQGYKRMVRDIAKSLNKKIKLNIIGEDTQVDREILEKIEAPINHMIRNAIDHGIETPEERIQNGKAEQGTINLEAAHNAGRLSIIVSDDGRGVDIEMIRTKVLDKKLVSKTMAENLSKSELLDFLFLPAFSTKDQVSEISGRGVGLDVVHSALQEMRGKLHSTTELGNGMKIHMELPLTLSVIRSLLVRINNELYAFPLATIHNLIKVDKSEISVLEDKQYITIDDKHVGLIHTAQILGTTSTSSDDKLLSIVIVGDWNNLYGLVVDEMIGERGLVLRPLDPRLGKVKDINSTALTDDGEPILVFDVDDLIQSIQDIVSGKNIAKIGTGAGADSNLKRILVVDDSLTVREVEKKLLESRGYTVDVAIDGVDGWNTVRTGDYAMVISDVDMPRMNGIELVTLIKSDAGLRNMPVMMVSYKDRAEDKQKGLEAGADYYLTKGSFHDETLVDAVRDLIGDPE
jgi:two-component system, chemotaxis family, sensor histidine kinase and response regulator WspE